MAIPYSRSLNTAKDRSNAKRFPALKLWQLMKEPELRDEKIRTTCWPLSSKDRFGTPSSKRKNE